ncbi:MAG: ATP-binding protein [bacterium]
MSSRALGLRRALQVPARRGGGTHIRFRLVAPDTKLEFGPGAVFLLGRNGSGKSTLLICWGV